MGAHPLRAGAAMVVVAVTLAGCGGAHHSATPVKRGTTTSRDVSYHAKPQGRLARLRLWVNPNTPAAAQIRLWRAHGRGAQATKLEAIARRATAVWLTSSSNPAPTIQATVGEASGTVAQLVLYDIPDRDCGGQSAGGAPSAAAYLRWVGKVVDALAGRRVILILEPDALDQAASGSCMSSAAAQARYHLMDKAVGLLRHDRRARVYIDAGHPGWESAKAMEPALYEAGITHAAGFSVNVANFDTTSASIAYGDSLSRLVGHAHFVIDTSRNGNGPPPSAGGATASWCNPSGRHVGTPPSTDTGHALVDAYLWVKYPGESDGSCAAGQPPAGSWWPSYALGLLADHR